jgi:hypothetical protein
MKTILTIVALAATFAAQAQSPTEYAALKAAGKVTLAPVTESKPDEKDPTKTVTVRKADAVNVTVPRFDPATGAQVGSNTRDFSIAGMKKDLANMEAEVVNLKAMIADAEAVK